MTSFNFRGGPVLTLDQKSRLTVPARYREELREKAGGKMVLCKNLDRCLSLFPAPMWEKFEAALNALSIDHENWRRLYIGSATDVEIDSGSRVLIPNDLKSWAGLDKEVKFMGVGANFELWDNAVYAAREAELILGGRPEAVRNIVIR